jgi:hypothetical protein
MDAHANGHTDVSNKSVALQDKRHREPESEFIIIAPLPRTGSPLHHSRGYLPLLFETADKRLKMKANPFFAHNKPLLVFSECHLRN